MAKQPGHRFWEEKTLEEMTAEEWESLCDGCGKCCVIKLEDVDTGDFYSTDIACTLLDGETCRCTNYASRKSLVPDCVVLTPGSVGMLPWMPATCAYRLLDEGKPLPDWHPLVTGDPDSTHLAGQSVKCRTISEENIAEEEYPHHIVDWDSDGDPRERAGHGRKRKTSRSRPGRGG